MLRRNRPTITAAAVSLIVVSGIGVWPAVSPTRAQNPEVHKDAARHGEDMFRSAAKPKTIAVSGPLLAVDRVRYTPLPSDSPLDDERGQTFVLIEGDIILGTEQFLEQAAAARVIQLAKAIDPNDPALGLSDTQKATINQLKAIPAQPNATEPARRKAEVARVLSQAAALGMRDAAGKPHLREISGATSKLRAELKDKAAKRRERQRPGQPDAPNAPGLIDEELEIVNQPAALPMVAGVGDSGLLWPQGVIPFEFGATFPAGQRSSVEQAIDHWHSRTTHVRFVARDRLRNPGQFANRIVFIPSTGCASRVGMKLTPGAQGVQLASGCFTPQVIHELGHVVGIWHEQSRNDRDTFLLLQPQNIDADKLFNFDKVGAAGTDFGAFDFDSIMLYPPKSFSSNGQPSMVRRTPGNPNFGINTGAVGGVTNGLSDLDVAGVESLYPSPAPTNP